MLCIPSFLMRNSSRSRAKGLVKMSANWAMYSTFVLDMAVVFCFFNDQLPNLSPNISILPDVLFLVSWQPAWSASAKAIRAMQQSFGYHKPILIDPHRGVLIYVDEVIRSVENGPTLPKTQVVEGVETVMPITSVEDKAQRRLEVKAKSTLMMGIPKEHQLKFNSIKDANQVMEAIEKRFGVNTAQVVNTANEVSTADTQVNTANIDNLSDVVIYAFLGFKGFNFDEFQETMTSDNNTSSVIPPRQMTFDHNSSNLAPQRQKASDYDNSGPEPQLQEISPPADKQTHHYRSWNYYSFLYTQSTLNDQPILELIISPTDVNDEENNNNKAEEAQFEAYKFINHFATLGTEAAKSYSCYVDSLNIHTFYQRHRSDFY
nr:hypothetical protein [Tanacetum cinerariifolium]